MVKVGKEVLKHGVNVTVDPVAVLQLDNEVKCVDVGQVFLAHGIFLKIFEQH